MDVNPIWWGQQAQREPEVMLKIFAVLVYCSPEVFKNATVFLFCVPSVHVVQVSGCSHGVRELPHGHGQDTQAGRHRQPLSRQVTLQ